MTYGAMLSLLVNSIYWMTETVLFLIGFAVWVYVVSSQSIVHAIEFCNEFKIDPESVEYSKCVNSYGSNPALFTMKQVAIFTFYLIIARLAFEGKERRLFLRGQVIQS